MDVRWLNRILFPVAALFVAGVCFLASGCGKKEDKDAAQSSETAPPQEAPAGGAFSEDAKDAKGDGRSVGEMVPGPAGAGGGEATAEEADTGAPSTAEMTAESSAEADAAASAKPEAAPEKAAKPSDRRNLPFADAASVQAQETFQIDPPTREIGRAWLEDEEKRTDFSMPVTGGRDLTIEVERFEAIGRDGGEFIGKVKGHPDSSVNLSYRGSGEAGTIRLPSENKVFRFFPGGDGSVVVQERNLAMDEPPVPLPPEDSEIPPVPDFTPPPPPQDLTENGPPGSGSATGSGGG